jgi:oxidoreductase, short chain dehydrogenase/reductase family
MNIVLVTGGTKGIGKAIVLKYLHQGCYAIITYSSDDETAELFQRELDVDYKDKYEIIKADLSKREEVKIMCNIISSKYRKIDYLILNAGSTNRNSFRDMTIDEWNYVINVNLTMPFFIVQSLVDCIIKGGSVLFIGAVMGIYPHAISIPYAVSKAGVHMLSKQLVKHLAPYKITVNTIAPGFVDTPWQKSKPLEQRIRIENKIALKRFALPEEIAQLCWDISQNSYINGSLLEIDGGYCYE